MCMLRVALHIVFTLRATERRRMQLPGVSPEASSRGSKTQRTKNRAGRRQRAAPVRGYMRLSWLIRHVDGAQRHPRQRMMFGQSKDWREEIVQGTLASRLQANDRPDVRAFPFAGRHSVRKPRTLSASAHCCLTPALCSPAHRLRHASLATICERPGRGVSRCDAKIARFAAADRRSPSASMCVSHGKPS